MSQEHRLEGKRVLVVWNDEMHHENQDWISWKVVAGFDKGLLLESVDSPDGQKADGSRIVMEWDQVNGVVEWKE